MKYKYWFLFVLVFLPVFLFAQNYAPEGSFVVINNRGEFGVASSSALYFDGDTGFLGLGTSTPETQLFVVGSTSIFGNLGIGTSTPQRSFHIVSSVFGDGPVVESDVAGSGAFLDFKSSDVGGQTWRFQSLGNVSGRQGEFAIVKPGVEAVFVIKGDTRNVGIKKTNPAYTLDVAGDINLSGVYRVGGTSGYTGTCSNVTYSGGIAVSCND